MSENGRILDSYVTLEFTDQNNSYSFQHESLRIRPLDHNFVAVYIHFNSLFNMLYESLQFIVREL